MKTPWMGLIAGLVLGQAQAASFDCAESRAASLYSAKAQTKSTHIERMICIDGVLSKLDEDLNAAYKAALQDQKQADSVKQAQKQWLKERNSCPNSVACVEQAYKKRLQELPPPPVQAISNAKPQPRFRVTEGKGWTVCENYVRFLNAQPQSEPPPLCHLTLSPDLKEPDWEELDIHRHLQLVYTLEKLTSPSEHDRPVDNFDHWKSVFEHQISTGEAAPRLRRVRLALVEGSPVETILAYEPDRNSCDNEVRKKGYTHVGSRTRLFIWNEHEQKIREDSHIAFGLSPRELLLFKSKPLLFWPWWGDVDGKTRYVEGRILVNHFITTGFVNAYGNLRRCEIGFELPSEITERMIK